jgi:hypothetical protein
VIADGEIKERLDNPEDSTDVTGVIITVVGRLGKGGSPDSRAYWSAAPSFRKSGHRRTGRIKSIGMPKESKPPKDTNKPRSLRDCPHCGATDVDVFVCSNDGCENREREGCTNPDIDGSGNPKCLYKYEYKVFCRLCNSEALLTGGGPTLRLKRKVRRKDA